MLHTALRARVHTQHTARPHTPETLAPLHSVRPTRVRAQINVLLLVVGECDCFAIVDWHGRLIHQIVRA